MKILKVLCVIFIIFALLIAAGIYYLNSYYLPAAGKAKLTEILSKTLKSEVTVDDIRFSLTKGLIVSKFTLRPETSPKQLISINQINAHILLLPSLQQKKLIFPSITLSGIRVAITRLADSTFDIQKILPQSQPTASADMNIDSLPVLIHTLLVRDTVISLRDESINPVMTHQFTIEELSAKIMPTQAEFNLSASLSHDDATGSIISLTGDIVYATKKASINGTLNHIDIVDYLAYAPDLPVNIRSLKLRNINCEGKYETGKLFLLLSADVRNLYVFKDDFLLSDGEAHITVKSDLALPLQSSDTINYRVTLDQARATVKTADLPDPLKINDMRLVIEPNKARIEQAVATLADMKTRLNGTITNFTNPSVSINLASTLNLPKVLTIAQQYVENIPDLVLSGRAELKAAVHGQFPQDITYQGDLTLVDASIQHHGSPYMLEAMNGAVSFTNDRVSWDKVSFTLFGEMLNSQASIDNFAQPKIDAHFFNPNIDIRAHIQTPKKDSYTISELRAAWYDSTISAHGNAVLTNPDTITLRIDGDAKLNLADLQKIKLPNQDTMNLLQPQGQINATFVVRGNAKDPVRLLSTLNLSSQRMRIYNLLFENTNVAVRQEEGQIKIPAFSSRLYGGTIAGNGLADLTKPHTPSAFQINLNSIDLALLKEDTPAHEQKIGGKLTAQLVASAPLDSFLDLEGQGTIVIENGYLWEFNPLKKLSDFLFIPRYQTLIFNHASADFLIKNQKLSTQNLILKSNAAILECRGTIDFHGNLNFEIIPTAVEGEQSNRDIFSEGFSTLAGVSTIRLTGTISDPKIDTQAVVRDVFKSVTNDLLQKALGRDEPKPAPESPDETKPAPEEDTDSTDQTLETIRGITDLIFGKPQ